MQTGALIQDTPGPRSLIVSAVRILFEINLKLNRTGVLIQTPETDLRCLSYVLHERLRIRRKAQQFNCGDLAQRRGSLEYQPLSLTHHGREVN